MPLLSAEKATHEQNSVNEMTFSCFENRHQMWCVPSCTVGTSAVATIKTKKTIQFVGWCPTSFKLGIFNEPLAYIPTGDLAKSSRSLCMLSK
ncbi:tubulin, alpha 3e [Boletus reticuloceps]|uniref:Tubulin, alpha 3e n=1 Tax=Boletus reticuloceps TaxID=495285 RepID=A0A8I2YJR5_9AGAM|nr:tubulin, alpha 3e [Boletus reticuloceps]